jgi:hypothetical protein
MSLFSSRKTAADTHSLPAHLGKGHVISRLIACTSVLVQLTVACKDECPPGRVQVGAVCRLEGALKDAGVEQDAGDTRSRALATMEANDDRPMNRASNAQGGRGGSEQHDGAQSGSGGSRSASSGGGGASGEPTRSADTAAKINAGAGAMAGNVGGASGALTPACGNGIKELGEECDGDCPTECPATTGCVSSKLKGTRENCDAMCVPQVIESLIAGDSCCPTGANAATDSDCPKSCGDGIVDANETCELKRSDKVCPSSCEDSEPCTTDMLIGTPAQCTAQCVHMPITAAKSGDMCCPKNANANSDSDCSPKCGNDVVEPGEKCDGSGCPRTCDDGDACTEDVMLGTACTAECSHQKITAANSGDGCCPAGKLKREDNDCSAECAGPSDCGAPSQCHQMQCRDGKCLNEPSASATCPGGTCTDTGECKPNAVCGNGKTEAGEECDPKATGWNDWTCSRDCARSSIYTPCSSDSDCHGDYFGKTPTCNVRYAICTIPCRGPNSCPDAPGGLSSGCATLDGAAVCVAYGCRSYTQCSLGSSCVPFPVNSADDQVCMGCGSHLDCPTGTMCLYNGQGGSFGVCR